MSTEPVSARSTIRDVAARAGVSVGTASKALNDRGRLSQETRVRVRAAAEALNFRANSSAQSLTSGRTYMVGLISTDSFGRFTMPILLGAEDALGAGQISILLCDTRDDPIRERHHVHTLMSRRVDGIIVAGRHVEPRTPITAAGIPVVYAMSQSSDPDDLSVIPDDEGGGAIAGRHLVTIGRRRIAHITGPTRFLATHKRAKGLTATLAAAGTSVAGGDVLFGEWSEEWGRQGTAILLRKDPNIDAIFAGNDQIARGAADAVRDSGRRIPDDVAIVGFDNWNAMAVGSRPPLTSVDANLHEVGKVAAHHLLATINGAPPERGLKTVPGWLVVRESTGIGTT